MDEHNKNVNNWKNSWKDNWKGNYQNIDDGYHYVADDDKPKNLKQIQSDLMSNDPRKQKAALSVVLGATVTVLIVALFMLRSIDISQFISEVQTWIGNG